MLLYQRLRRALAVEFFEGCSKGRVALVDAISIYSNMWPDWNNREIFFANSIERILFDSLYWAIVIHSEPCNNNNPLPRLPALLRTGYVLAYLNRTSFGEQNNEFPASKRLSPSVTWWYYEFFVLGAFLPHYGLLADWDENKLTAWKDTFERLKELEKISLPNHGLAPTVNHYALIGLAQLQAGDAKLSITWFQQAFQAEIDFSFSCVAHAVKIWLAFRVFSDAPDTWLRSELGEDVLFASTTRNCERYLDRLIVFHHERLTALGRHNKASRFLVRYKDTYGEGRDTSRSYRVVDYHVCPILKTNLEPGFAPGLDINLVPRLPLRGSS